MSHRIVGGWIWVSCFVVLCWTKWTPRIPWLVSRTTQAGFRTVVTWVEPWSCKEAIWMGPWETQEHGDTCQRTSLFLTDAHLISRAPASPTKPGIQRMGKTKGGVAAGLPQWGWPWEHGGLQQLSPQHHEESLLYHLHAVLCWSMLWPPHGKDPIPNNVTLTGTHSPAVAN